LQVLLTESDRLPKLALKPCVSNPVAISELVAYDAYAANEGVRVAAKEKNQPPKTQKTTEGKVLPRTHSRRPAVNCIRPPKK
jgi:hypothetical protein